METIYITNKGQMMDTLEKFYLLRETKINNHINDKLTVKPNIIFYIIARNDRLEGYLIPAADNHTTHNPIHLHNTLYYSMQRPP